MLSALDCISRANKKCFKVLTKWLLSLGNSVWWVIKQKCRANVSVWINDWLNLQPPLISTFGEEKNTFYRIFPKFVKEMNVHLTARMLEINFPAQFKPGLQSNTFPFQVILTWSQIGSLFWTSTWGQFGYTEKNKKALEFRFIVIECQPHWQPIVTFWKSFIFSTSAWHKSPN